MVRLLVFTSLYPNAEQPRHGVFVEERLRKLVASGRIAATVMAPVPWFPFRNQRFGDYARFARVPKREERHGISVLHPRYPVIPKVGMSVAPSLMYHALMPALRRLMASGADFDLIDAHYFYPDGVVAARIGTVLDKPVVISARGTDLNLLPRYRIPRRNIQWAAERAAAVLTVSRSLKDKAEILGVEPLKVTALRNGVDLEQFRPLDRVSIRASLNLTGHVWLTVGNLTEQKGMHLAITSLAGIPDVTLLIAGEGPDEKPLRQLALDLHVANRVRFLGAVEHDELCRYYNAADVMVLATASEGMPNVVLESLACGTAVVATAVDGIPEVVSAPEAGELMHERSSQALAAAWRAFQERAPDRASTRKFAEALGWGTVIEAQCALYARVVAGAR